MNVFDKFYEVTNPEKALRRMKARVVMQNVKNSGYDESGASHRKTSMKGWAANSRSPQKDIDWNLHTLRQRSRSLFMNSPIATGAIKTERTNVIGQGLVVRPKIDYEYLGISKEEAKGIEKIIKKEFGMWANSRFADATHQNNFYEIQQIAFLNTLISGEVFAFPFYKSESTSPYQLRIRLVEADRISTPGSVSGDCVDLDKKAENGNRIWNGVEIDDEGAAVAYYVCNSYPLDFERKKEWNRIEVIGKNTGNLNVLHVFEAERPEQYRGVPFLAPVIETLKQLTRYSEAEITAAVIAGMFTIFVKNENGEENIDFAGVMEEEDTEEEKEEYKMGPGMINYLSGNESIEVADPKRPNSNYDGFVQSFCKYIGTALEIPVDVLLKSFNASYSASRASLMEAWKSFRMRRAWFVSDFCQPVYELFLSEAVSKGYIDMPGFFLDSRIRDAYCQATWNGPAPGQLDPTKEAQAAQMRVQNGFSTAEQEATEINGSDFEQNVEQRKEELEKMREAGMLGGETNAGS